jgi:hypothetical protein
MMGTVRLSRFFVSEREFLPVHVPSGHSRFNSCPHREARGCNGDLHRLREQLQVLDAEAVNLLSKRRKESD